jgi:lipopolysaccharide export system protein LptA
MRRKILVPIVVVSLLCGALFYAASGHNYHYAVDYDALFAAPETKSAERHMVDMIADDSYLIEQGDSTVFILVGNFAAHHNGTVILADSAIRYPNQSFECFGNVLINQNETYAYGDRAHYDRANSTATIYSELVKVVDGDAVMYTYNCMFDTADEVGIFYDGCYVRKGESHLEAERGYYNTQTHDLIAVDNVEMRDEKYLMTGDSVIFNTQTEDAQYFTNTNIWNEKDEYLFANAGNYAKAEDLYHLTRDAYMLSEEREVWSDTIEYYRTTGHIIGRSNIQMDDTTQKILGFADYGEWWDDLDNALFTRRPSMINYNTDEPDSIYLCADTLWLYTIPVLPPSADTTSNSAAREADKERGDRDSMPDMQDYTMREDIDNVVEESNDESEAMKPSKDLSEVLGDDENLNKRENNVEKSTGVAEKSSGKSDAQKPSKDLSEMLGEDGNLNKREEHDRKRQTKSGEELKRNLGTVSGEDTMLNDSQRTEPREDEVDSVATDSLSSIVSVADTLITDSIRLDSTAVDTLSKDSVKVLTPRQIRYRAKMERRRVRDSIRTMERIVQDSLDSIKQREMDSIQHIRDSLLKIEIDSLIAKRRARSAQLADEEKARLERVKQKTEERNRRKIDKAKARALKRGKVYTGPDYVIDSVATDSLAVDSVAVDSIVREERDTMLVDTLAADTTRMDSLGRDSINMTPPFPDDSVYKMIKAYRRVKMYRSDSQMVCDSMTMLNTDSIIRLYIEPVMWNEDNQITSDSMAIHTRNEVITKAHFMGNPMMGMEIDTMYYNQVAGKDMTAYFADGEVYRNDVDGNAQTIYYMQEEDSPEVTGLMYIESASISFYLVESEIDKIAYKQNPTYVLYPMNMIPETQDLKLKDFNWYYERRPLRDSIFNRSIRPTQRDNVASRQKPRFRITERIDYDRRRLVENRMWEDRVDQLTPEVIEWRNTRATYPNK